MSLLFRVIVAANASGTHHRLAFDGVRRLEGPDAAAWQRLFLKHAEILAKGSKAPDDEFKDFKNHVLHPRDNFWGGAPETARKWYRDLVDKLAQGDWPAAVRSAGILSHYVTDPIAPFHTAQSEAENAIHRAFEWSVSRSYDALKAISAADAARSVAIVDGPDWLEHLLCDCAVDSNRYYEKLIAHYDIHRGVVDPPSGLDQIAQRIVGDLLGEASAVYAAVLQRAITESKASPPEVSLGMDAVLSTLRIPLKKVLNKLADAKERKQVEAIYDELKATGTVERNLPEDDRVVSDLYAAEVMAARSGPSPAARAAAAGAIAPASPPVTAAPPQAVATPVANVTRPPPLPGAAKGVAEPTALERAPMTRLSDRLAGNVKEPPPSLDAKPVDAPRAATSVPTVAPSRPAPAPTPAPIAPTNVTPLPVAPPAPAQPRIYLTPDQPVVDAPSIGPRMAERLTPLGLKTVADLLAADSGKLAARLAMSSVDADTVVEWQDQARLVCTVPGLRGTHAQLLVGAGYRTVDAIAAAPVDDLCARVLSFAASADGQRVLRAGDAPDIEKIKSWTTSARAVRTAA